MIEAGVGNAKSYIKDRQSKFLHKLLARNNFLTSYIGNFINMAIDVRCPAGVILSELKNLGPEHDFRMQSLSDAASAIEGSVSTRRFTYLALNRTLSHNPALNATNNIPEFCRIAYTRIRTSSHRLRVETGRWARIPLESRLCGCGDIQTEEHVLLKCPLTLDIRSRYPNTQECADISQLMDVNNPNILDVCLLCAKVLEFFS